MSRRKEGFTLIELVVVIVILGILAAIAASKYVDLTGKANESHDKATLDSLRTSTMLLYASNILEGATATNVFGQYWPTELQVTNNMTTIIDWLFYTNATYNLSNGVWTAQGP